MDQELSASDHNTIQRAVAAIVAAQATSGQALLEVGDGHGWSQIPVRLYPQALDALLSRLPSDPTMAAGIVAGLITPDARRRLMVHHGVVGQCLARVAQWSGVPPAAWWNPDSELLNIKRLQKIANQVIDWRLMGQIAQDAPGWLDGVLGWDEDPGKDSVKRGTIARNLVLILGGDQLKELFIGAVARDLRKGQGAKELGAALVGLLERCSDEQLDTCRTQACRIAWFVADKGQVLPPLRTGQPQAWQSMQIAPKQTWAELGRTVLVRASLMSEAAEQAEQAVKTDAGSAAGKPRM
jgi:hypothetical protein